MQNPKSIKFSNFLQSTRQDDQLSQRIWMEEMNTFMDWTLKKQHPRRWKTEDREKTYNERNEIEISNNESRHQIAFKRNSTTLELDLRLHPTNPPGSQSGWSQQARSPRTRTMLSASPGAVSLSHSTGTCLPHGRLQRCSWEWSPKEDKGSGILHLICQDTKFHKWTFLKLQISSMLSICLMDANKPHLLVYLTLKSLS